MSKRRNKGPRSKEKKNTCPFYQGYSFSIISIFGVLASSAGFRPSFRDSGDEGSSQPFSRYPNNKQIKRAALSLISCSDQLRHSGARASKETFILIQQSSAERCSEIRQFLNQIFFNKTRLILQLILAS